ncbi:MAG TPA: hypothetical protein PKE39_15980 [Ignavibacteria bacterium]|nr:hypothetical protein [Ignavibacteria bacterium]HMR00523.1 hypothetical protein [Ignavibacteria bacterium]
MNKKEFWLNFNLGTELSVSGNFIYNGLKSLDNIEFFTEEPNVFEFLYNISVGIERLLKISVILIENESYEDLKKLEKELKNHNHQLLINRLKKFEDIKIGKEHISFLDLLNKFYNDLRYDRYSISNTNIFVNEKTELMKYFNKYFGVEISEDDFFATPNSDEVKIKFGIMLGKICSLLYDLIVNKCSELNIYTYEQNSQSKSYKIFIRKEYNFIKERLALKEMIIFLLNNNEDSELKKIVKTLKPIAFDNSFQEVILGLENDIKKDNFIDQLEEVYEEINDVERENIIEIMDNPNYSIM